MNGTGDIMLGEISQSQKDKYYAFAHMWNLVLKKLYDMTIKGGVSVCVYMRHAGGWGGEKVGVTVREVHYMYVCMEIAQ
jgi:hypothetical protein